MSILCCIYYSFYRKHPNAHRRTCRGLIGD
ncbi:hypothetical protein QE152_g41164, partial [Popillia japonica]